MDFDVSHSAMRMTGIAGLSNDIRLSDAQTSRLGIPFADTLAR
jgi:hypothetical protein